MVQKTCGIVQISVKYTKFGRDIKVNTLSISGNERWIQISVYYEQHLIEQHQLALSKFSSKTVALLKVVDSWKFVIDDGLKSVCVFLDLRKACGVIMHDILLAKLESYGIKGNALQWVNSYLLGRSQFVVCVVTPVLSSDISRLESRKGRSGVQLYLIAELHARAWAEPHS